jgi:hypothetical protein
MSNIIPPTSASNLIVNDTQYEVVPRRRFERRSVSDQQAIKPELATENEDIKMHKVDKRQAKFLREDERRQSARRSSRPTLLSVDEIAKLRKK